MAFQVEFTDRDGETCWADFSAMWMAEEYVNDLGGEIVSFDEYEDEWDDEPDVDEAQEWYDFDPDC